MLEQPVSNVEPRTAAPKTQLVNLRVIITASNIMRGYSSKEMAHDVRRTYRRQYLRGVGLLLLSNPLKFRLVRASLAA